MMDKIFAWKTIDEEKITVNTKYSFGETINSDNISEWTSRHFDLKISSEVFLSGMEISEFLQENEKASWIIIWRGDKRITGSGIRVSYEPGIPQTVECTVPSGSLISGFEAELFLVTVKNESAGSFSNRPDGSIICRKVLYYSDTLSEGGFFPIREFSGDGKNLFYWTFSNTEDLNVSVSYGVTVHIDRNHPFIHNMHNNAETRSLLLLMIIQSYFQKAMSDDIFNRVNSETKNEHINGSMGRSFLFMLDSVRNQLRLYTLADLKDRYNKKPEEVNKALLEIYTKSLKNA
jgi:hypothetical protein